jgi:hypothetical protein
VPGAAGRRGGDETAATSSSLLVVEILVLRSGVGIQVLGAAIVCGQILDVVSLPSMSVVSLVV